jgi:uncharacterized membrane protein YfcA
MVDEKRRLIRKRDDKTLPQAGDLIKVCVGLCRRYTGEPYGGFSRAAEYDIQWDRSSTGIHSARKAVSLSDRRFKSMASSIRPLGREFIREPLPLALGTFALAIALSLLVYGYLPGVERAFPVAGIKVAVRHLVFLGLWTGYVMGLIGQANGILSLPYCISILGFTSISVSPTSLLITLLNPLGALTGYYRGRQWNLDLALWLCIGAAVGSPLGPIIRFKFLLDPTPFKAAVGLALMVMSIHLLVQGRLFRRRRPELIPFKDFRVRTLERSYRKITISFLGENKTINVPAMLFLGFFVGAISSTLGIGGGFMLVPILMTVFGLPMYVLVAASFPFVTVLSLIGLLSYILVLPALSGSYATPDWAFGFFAASGAILGSWFASKSQRYFPERILRILLGSITGVIGLLYIIDYFSLPTPLYWVKLVSSTLGQ